MDFSKKTKKITGNLFLIYEKMFPLYLIKEEKTFLIDCSISAYSEEIITGLKEVLKGKRLDYILLTHSHYDHTGACPAITDEFGPKICASERAEAVLKKDSVKKQIFKLNKKFETILGKNSNISSFDLPQIYTLNENDKIDAGNNKNIRVISTPGHTKGSVSYILEPDKILFPGDAAGVLERNGKFKPLFLSNYSDYLSSIKKLMDQHAKILALPHNMYISGEERVRDFLKNSLVESRRLEKLIRDKLSSGTEINNVADEILKKEFPKPTVEGPGEAFTINLSAMVNAVKKEMDN